MPKFAANLTMLFNELPFLDRFAAAKNAGFGGVEYLFPYDFEKGVLAEHLQQYGLTQVLHNLLDNAVKYGREAGTIRLSVRAAESDPRFPARAGVVVAVADDGVGIPREHLPRLTERFYRVDAGRSRAAGGTGLGLAIVKHIVLRHRGRLMIESKPGQGAAFKAILPRFGAARGAG